MKKSLVKKRASASLADLLKQSNPHSTAAGESGIYPLTDGVEAFAMRATLIKNAQHSLDLQYYSLHKGLSSRLLIRDLVRAADRGVQVRILIDDMNMLGRDHEMTIFSAHPNISVRMYNPVRRFRATAVSRIVMFAFNLKTLQRRMHNKVWIADNTLAITGGRNIGDRYFNASSSDNFADLDVLVGGQVVADMQASFDQYWQAPEVLPVEAFEKNPAGDVVAIQKMIFKTNALTRKERVARHPYLNALNESETHILPRVLPQMLWGQIDFFADAPDKINQSPPSMLVQINPSGSVPFDALLPYIQNAKKEVLIVSPYFIPGDGFTQVLSDLMARGVRVILFSNSLESNDVPLVNGPYGRYRKTLLQAGLELYELRGFPDVPKEPQWRLPFFSWNGSRIALHSKAVVIDGETSFVGSMNIDPRSLVWNTELGLIAHSDAFAKQLRAGFFSAFEPRYSYKVTLDGQGRLNWSAPIEGLPPTRVEPGNLWRRLQRNIAVSPFETFL